MTLALLDLREDRRRPVELRSRPYSRLSETLGKMHELVSDHCGLVVSLRYARYSALFRTAHTYTAHLERMSLHASRDLTRARAISPDRWQQEQLEGRVGISLSTDQAKAFCGSVGEGIERYSQIMMYDSAACVTAPWQDLGEFALDPRTFHGYDDDEYRRFPTYQPFRPNAPMRWTWARNLATGDWKLTPTQLSWVLYNLLPGEPRIKQGTSNGWAAHNTTEEALMKCLNENLERDSYVIQWYNRLAMPRVDLDTVGNPRVQAVREVFDRVGADLHVINTTTDVGYPTFVAVATNDHAGYAPVTVTLGAGLDPEIGILRSVEECLASYILNTALRRDGMALGPGQEAVALLDHFRYYLDPARRRQLEWMWSSPDVVSARELPRHQSPDGDVKADIQRAMKLLGQAGIESYAIDTTPADVEEAGFRTAKVLSPQICQVEFGQGLIGRRSPRLYDVPVRLGYRDRPLRPQELNPGVHPHS